MPIVFGSDAAHKQLERDRRLFDELTEKRNEAAKRKRLLEDQLLAGGTDGDILRCVSAWREAELELRSLRAIKRPKQFGVTL